MPRHTHVCLKEVGQGSRKGTLHDVSPHFTVVVSRDEHCPDPCPASFCLGWQRHPHRQDTEVFDPELLILQICHQGAGLGLHKSLPHDARWGVWRLHDDSDEPLALLQNHLKG